MMDVDAIKLYQLTNKPDDTTYIPVYNPSMAPYDFVAYSPAHCSRFKVCA